MIPGLQKKSAYLDLLKEQTDLTRNSSWTETKRAIDSDSRYKDIDSSNRREDYFRDYIRGIGEVYIIALHHLTLMYSNICVHLFVVV